MAAYVIVDIRVTDPAPYEEYKRLAHPTIGAFGGRYLARGGGVKVLEGSLSIRYDTAESTMLVVEGC